jgi:hypothetical protein
MPRTKTYKISFNIGAHGTMSIKAQNSDEALDKFHSLSNEKVVSRATIECQTADIDAYRADEEEP